MKKLLLLLVMTICAINSFAQYTDGVYHKPKAHNNNVAGMKNSNIEDYEYWNKKASYWQYGAIGSAAVSAASFIAFAALDTKYNYTEGNKGKIEKDGFRTPAKNYLIAGSAAAAVAILCQISAIECKLQANKSLKMYITNNGAGMTFNF